MASRVVSRASALLTRVEGPHDNAPRDSHTRVAEHFVYILECAYETYYVGSAADPAFRLEYHQSGRGADYTAKRLPVRLVFQEVHPSVDAARQRERQIKKWSHAKKAALVAADRGRLKDLSRSHQRKKR